MVVLKNINELAKHLAKNQIKQALENDVAEQSRKTLKENVIDEVYDTYSPTQYERTGGLYQDRNIDTKMENDTTLSIRSTREENGRDIASVIEYGEGYSYEGLDERIGARPFHEETAKELADKGLAKKALAEGLRKQGLNVK